MSHLVWPQGSSFKEYLNEGGKGNNLRPILDWKYLNVLSRDETELKFLCTACDQELSALTIVSTKV